VAVGKEYYPLIRSHGGLALDYVSIAESDFAGSAGVAYSPPEESNDAFRRIVSSRAIQILAECPVIVETFQTSAATLRLPANTVTDYSNDSADGRIFIIKNTGTGNIVISDYIGTTLFTLISGIVIMVVGNNNNTWDFIFTGKNTFFDKTIIPALGFVSNNLEDAIYELATKASVSASPGFTWGRSGNVTSGWLQNETVPSDITGRNFPLYNGELMQLSVANEGVNTFTLELYEHDGTTYTLKATVALVAQRSKVQTFSGVTIAHDREIGIKFASGSGKNIVVQAILKGSSVP
jgi:hypothetical protein